MPSVITGFNGERIDPVSSYYHLGNGYRGYNPLLMRFSCPDSWSPFGAGGINAYVYCTGDPVNRADPSGHMSWQTGVGIGLGILGILGAVFTAGASVAAAGSISAALGAASTVGLVAGTSALVADVTGVASAATDESSPGVSAVLGWLSLSAGILSLGVGLAPKLGALAGKADRAFGKGLQSIVPFLSKIERRGNQVGIPMSGEFRDPTFLGRYRQDGHIRWSFRYEDDVPMGRRLNIVMGSENIRRYYQGVSEVQTRNQWWSNIFTPARLRDLAVGNQESFNVYRLIMSNSGITARSRSSFARRFYDILTEARPVVGFRDTPTLSGPVAEHLQSTFHKLDQLETSGFNSMWDSNTAQVLLDGLAQRYGNVSDSLVINGNSEIFPLEFRGIYSLDNFL